MVHDINGFLNVFMELFVLESPGAYLGFQGFPAKSKQLYIVSKEAPPWLGPTGEKIFEN